MPSLLLASTVFVTLLKAVNSRFVSGGFSQQTTFPLVFFPWFLAHSRHPAIVPPSISHIASYAISVTAGPASRSIPGVVNLCNTLYTWATSIPIDGPSAGLYSSILNVVSYNPLSLNLSYIGTINCSSLAASCGGYIIISSVVAALRALRSILSMVLLMVFIVAYMAAILANLSAHTYCWAISVS